MVVKHIDPPKFDKIPSSELYANASVVSISSTSDLIQFAGQSGRDPRDGNLPNEIEGQIDNVLKRYDVLLEFTGVKKTDITQITYHVADSLKSEQLIALGPKFGKWFEGNRPAATLARVTGFLDPGYLLEVTMTAVKHRDG